MTDMVERVARALAVATNVNPDTVGTATDLGLAPYRGVIDLTSKPAPFWTFYIPEARAAIEAMREPTKEMSRNGELGPSAAQVRLMRCDQDDFYRLMIDRALGCPDALPSFMAKVMGKVKRAAT